MVIYYFASVPLFIYLQYIAYSETANSKEADTIERILVIGKGDLSLVFTVIFFLVLITAISLFLYLNTLKRKNKELQFLYEENEKQRKIFDTLFQISPVGIVVTDLSGKIFTYNQEFVELFKLEKSRNYNGIFVQDLLQDREFRKCFEEIYAKIEEKSKFFNKFNIVLSDGSIRYFRHICNFVESKDVTNYLLINVFVDITEQELFEIKIRKAEEKYRSFIELSTDAIYCFEGKEPISVDLPVEEQIELFFQNGFLSECNLSFAKFYGFSNVQDAIGTPLSKIISPANPSKMALLLNFISNNYSVDGFITNIPDEIGNLKYVQNSMFGVVENGQLIRVWGSFKDITELINLQKQYQETALKYENLIENANSIILHLDLNGNILFINNYGLEFFGYTKDELLGKSVIGTIFPEVESITGRDLTDLIKEIVANPKKFEYNENENVKKDGTRVWIHWKNTPILDSTGKCVEILSVGIDMTDRRKKELELQRTWNFVFSMFDALPDAICLKDGDGKWFYANKTMLEIFNLVGKEIVGKTDLDLIEYDEYYREALEYCVVTDDLAWKSKVPVRSEEIIKTKDGKTVIFDVIKVPSFNSDGTRMGIVVVGRDVTKQKEMENILVESEQKHKEILNALPLPSFVVSNGKVVFANTYAKKLFEELNKNEEIEFTLLRKYFKDEDFNKLIELSSSRKGYEKVSFNVESSDGGKIFAFSYVPVLFEKNYSSMFVLNDVTEQVLYSSYLERVQKELIYQKYELERINKELNEKNKELAELNATKDKFFSIIAHDIKNPVYGIKNLTDEFLRSFDELKFDEMREFVLALNSSSSKLADLVEDLLLWARTQTKTINYNPTEINLKYIVDNTLSFYLETAKQKNIVLLNRIEENTYVYADANCLSTILRNLISNAIKFTNEGGVVRIFSTEIEEFGSLYEKISVQDNGIGIPYEIKDKLLQLDFHYSGLGTRNERGTGLGLSITNELVQLNGGRLWFESTPKIGTTFHFTLPKNKRIE